MRLTSLNNWLMAMGGVASSRLSKWVRRMASRGSSSPRTKTQASFSSTRASGRRTMAVPRLKKMWVSAICSRMLSGTSRAIQPASGSVNASVMKMAAPMILNSRWTTAARLAAWLVPAEAMRAVTQVPMFWPKRMNRAPSMPISFWAANTCKMPIEAELDWMMAVMPAPTSTPRTGLLNPSIRLLKASQSRSGTMAADMVFMPMNRMPRPISTFPACRTFSLRLPKIKNMPMPAKITPKSILTDSSSDVTVVPILAPMMTPTA